jgi:phage terminase large subunit-like protein
MPGGADRSSFYDRHQRNPEAKRFYASAAWSGPNGARTQYIRAHPICERCAKVVADHVHHKLPLAQCTPEQRLDPANLMSVCISCHNAIEAQTPEQQLSTPIGTIEPIEDETYYFDAEAADRPCRFIERFCRHYEGRFAGEQFKLLDWQRETIRKLFGWKHRDSNLRRFRELYLISGKGAGKTPLIAAVQLYMLLGDNEAAAHVISMASSFEQANLTFDAGKKYIIESPELSRHTGINVKQYAIEAPRYSRWTTISGKPNGRSGPRPSCIAADEAHEWPAATGIAFDLLCANLFKRSQPLLLVATNAGPDRQCYAWTLHERACGVLLGTVDDPTLLPVIFEAPKELDWRSEEAAKAANPSLGDIVSFEQLKPEQSKGEARYRRLYLSQWISGSDKWLDLTTWDACIHPLNAEAIKGAPRYVGLDLSNGDDLCAMVDCYTTTTTFHIDSHFWIPKVTAEKYEAKDLHPYHEWGEVGAITLLDSPTISIEAQKLIAQYVIDEHYRHPIVAVCFDRAYSTGVIEIIRAAGIRCEPIGQGWGVSQGCAELDRRLIERSISIAPNAVLRFCASNVEIKTDERGNYWPVKPHARGKYAGRRAAKIDGISSLVTCLTEARKHNFPQPAIHAGASIIEL